MEAHEENARLHQQVTGLSRELARSKKDVSARVNFIALLRRESGQKPGRLVLIVVFCAVPLLAAVYCFSVGNGKADGSHQATVSKRSVGSLDKVQFPPGVGAQGQMRSSRAARKRDGVCFMLVQFVEDLVGSCKTCCCYICVSCSWEAFIATCSLLVVTGLVGALLWHLGYIQPVLKQLVVYLYIAVVLLAILLVGGLEASVKLQKHSQSYTDLLFDGMGTMNDLHTKIDSVLGQLGIPGMADTQKQGAWSHPVFKRADSSAAGSHDVVRKPETHPSPLSASTVQAKAMPPSQQTIC